MTSISRLFVGSTPGVGIGIGIGIGQFYAFVSDGALNFWPEGQTRLPQIVLRL